jgi:predicted transcriptional regulator
MKRSKLEIKLDILRVIAQKGPMRLTHIMCKANLNCEALKKTLEFLIKHNLVEDCTTPEGAVLYKITPQGFKLLIDFKEVNQLFPTEENEY